MAISMRDFAQRLIERLILWMSVCILASAIVLGAQTFRDTAMQVAHTFQVVGEELRAPPPQKPPAKIGLPDDLGTLDHFDRKPRPVMTERNLPLRL